MVYSDWGFPRLSILMRKLLISLALWAGLASSAIADVTGNLHGNGDIKFNPPAGSMSGHLYGNGDFYVLGAPVFNVTSPTDGQCLVYSMSVAAFINSSCGAGGGGTVTSASVVSANGLSGTVATPTTTPAITLSTTFAGIAFSTAGVLQAAIAANFPTLNQNTSGTAATATQLASTPAQCSAGQYSTGITAAGIANCAQVSASQLSNGVTGSGAVVLTTSPTLVTPNLGTPSALILTNATALPLSALANQGTTVSVLHGNASGAPAYGAVNLVSDIIGVLPLTNLATCSTNNVLFASSATVVACNAAFTYTLGTGVLALSTTTPTVIRQTDTSASANTQIFQRTVTGSASTGVLHEQSCTGALVCTDWITATRASVGHPGVVDDALMSVVNADISASASIELQTTVGGFGAIILSASDNNPSSVQVLIGSGDISQQCDLDLDCGLFLANNNNGTEAYAHMQIASGAFVGASVFDFANLSTNATLISLPALGCGSLIALPVVCLSGVGPATQEVAFGQGTYAAGVGAGGFVPVLSSHATTDTAGFFWIPITSGPPTGVPANTTGIYAVAKPMDYDIVNDRLSVFNGSWKGVSLESQAAPTVSSGFGTSPSVSANKGPASFSVNVGTGGAASSGVIGLPTAAHGWACYATDVTTPTGNSTWQTASSTTTATFTNYSRTLGTASAWTASDIIEIGCRPN